MYSISCTVFYKFCLIGQSNLECHWNLVDSFKVREDDCQFCDPSMVAFPLSSFFFVYPIMTRFEWKLLALWILWLLLVFLWRKGFSTERKSCDRQSTTPSKWKNYSVPHHEMHSKMSLPGIVIITNRVSNTGLNCFSMT